MNVIITVSNVIFILCFLYWYSRQNPPWQLIFWPAALLKLMSGIVLGLLYTYYYQASDTFLFFHDGVCLSNLGRTDFNEYLNFLWDGDRSYAVWQKLQEHQYRALLLAKITSLINLVTADNYWITSLYFSLISFVCSWRFVLTLVKYFPSQKAAAIISFLFVPSVVFWSSGIMKETIALASIFFITHTFLSLWMQDKISVMSWTVSVLCVWVLWEIKYYYLAVLAPILCASLLSRFIISSLFQIKKPGYEIMVWFIVFILSVYVVSLSRKNFHAEKIAQVIVRNHDVSQSFSKSNGGIHFHHLQATGFSLIENTPLALFSGFFRPFIWETTNVFQSILALENLFILILFIMALKNCNEVFQSSNRLLNLSVIVYSSLLCAFLALSTPNFGTLSRYRVGFLPFFIFLLMYRNPLVAYFSKFIQRKNSHLVR